MKNLHHTGMYLLKNILLFPINGSLKKYNNINVTIVNIVYACVTVEKYEGI